MGKYCIALLCFISANVFSLQASPHAIKIQHWQTSVNTNVYFVMIHSLPIVDVRVIFAAGSAYDNKMIGLASLTNSMIGEGTTMQNADQIAKAFDDIGAQFNTSLDRDKAVVSLRSLSKPAFFNSALSEFIQVLTKMSFQPNTLRRIKNQTIAMINTESQNPRKVARNTFYRMIYGDQPYSHNPLGTVASIKRFLSKNINCFYRRYYVARNADIVLVGDLSYKQAKRISERIAITMPIGKVAPHLKENQLLKKNVYHHVSFPAKQTSIMVGQVGISWNNPDYFPLLVGNTILGGLPLGSLLFQKIRNQNGFAYDVGSIFWPLRYRGPFIIQLRTRVNKAKKALSTVMEVLNAFLKQGPNPWQLDAVKKNLIGSFPLKMTSNRDIAAFVSLIAFYHLPLSYLEAYKARITNVSSSEVKVAFNKIINQKHLAVVTVGPSF